MGLVSTQPLTEMSTRIFLGQRAAGAWERVCPHGEEVHARKWKLYAATQDTALVTAERISISFVRSTINSLGMVCFGAKPFAARI
jgi:hypothetical protein